MNAMTILKKLLLFPLVLCILAGCAPATAMPTLVPAVSKDRAVELAVKNAMASRPEVGPGLEAPSNVEASRMTLKAAVDRLHPEGAGMPSGRRATDMVWLVSLDGRWEGQGIAAAPNTTPPVYRHFTIILDGVTGEEVESALTP